MQDPELVNSIKQWILQPTLEYIDRTRTVDAIVHSHAAVVSPTSFQTARSLVGLPRYVRVTNYAPRFDTSRFPYIDHLPVLQQTFGCLCGFHALHNMCCFVHALFAPDLKRKVKHLLKLRNSFSYVSPANVSSFWRFYGKIRDNLIEYLKSNEEEYNIESYMHDGSLDSDHLSYLLQFYPKLIKVFSSYPGYRIEHCQLFFSYGNPSNAKYRPLHIRNPEEAVRGPGAAGRLHQLETAGGLHHLSGGHQALGMSAV
ncbi:MAG: hypothetical protein P4M11_07840 [Candidatus Pacebacteria bacterium]|nr:hypothetical protein [Candidatus Paceibacterota bacterium]